MGLTMTPTLTVIEIAEHKQIPTGAMTWVVTGEVSISPVLAAYRRKFGREPERVWHKGTMWWCEVKR